MYPAMLQKNLSGKEPIVSNDGEKICELADFWRWAYSVLNANALRGTLAEFIVACTLGVQDSGRVLWDKYDLITREGIKIEVKASGYLQIWQQKKLSKPVFGINPTYARDGAENKYADVKRRQADIYVFCVHKHKEQETLNPLLVSQWDFYLLPARILDEKFGQQKTATLARLIEVGTEKCEYKCIAKRISELMKNANDIQNA